MSATDPLTPRVVLPQRSVLGEGPIWDARHRALYWVDILSGNLHEYLPALDQHQTYPLGEAVGAVGLMDNGDFLAALKSGLTRVDRTTGAKTLLAHPEAARPGNRYNDGKCDPRGRFWIGSMALDEAARAGSLYCLNADLSVHTALPTVSISNGLAWSPDHTTLYYIDSPEHCVFAFDYDPETGGISNRRVAANIPPEEGVPDGMCIDREGMLWVAHWDGWQVARWDPATGTKLLGIRLPAARITSCCFGGPDLTDLYITSARVGLTDTELAQQPEAGALFVIPDCGFRGFEPFRFRGGNQTQT